MVWVSVWFDERARMCKHPSLGRLALEDRVVLGSGWRRRSVVGVLCTTLAAVGLLASVSGPAVGDAWPGSNGRIAYKGDPNNIFTINPDGSGVQQLTTGSLENEEPHWSADGTKLLFTRSDESGVQDIWSMNADGSNQVRLNTSTGNGFSENPSWSPDGTKIIFTKQVDGGTHEELWTANADGSSQLQLTHDSCSASSEAVYSPDGSKIAFQLEPNFCNSSASAASAASL